MLWSDGVMVVSWWCSDGLVVLWCIFMVFSHYELYHATRTSWKPFILHGIVMVLWWCDGVVMVWLCGVDLVVLWCYGVYWRYCPSLLTMQSNRNLVVAIQHVWCCNGVMMMWWCSDGVVCSEWYDGVVLVWLCIGDALLWWWVYLDGAARCV